MPAGRGRARARATAGRTSAADLLAPIGVWVIAAKLALVPLVVDPQAADAFALPKVALSHALTYVLGVILGAVALHRGLPLRSRLLLAGVGLYAILAGLSTALAVHPLTSLFGAPRRLLGLTTVLDGAVLVLAMTALIRSTRDIALVVGAFLASAVLVIAYAWIQILGGDPIRWTSPDVVTSTVGNTGALAGYLVVVASAALAVALRGDLPVRIRLACLGLMATAAITTLATGARGPSTALPIGLAGAAALALRARPKWPVRRILVGAALALLALAVALPLTPVSSRLGRLFTGGDASTAERASIYGTALAALGERPVLGAGPDGFIAVYLAVRPEESVHIPGASPLQSSTHSWYLHHLVGTGFLGSISIVAIALIALASAWVRVRSGDPGSVLGLACLGAFLLQGAFNISHVVTEMVWWAGLGLVGARLDEGSARLLSAHQAWAHLPAKERTRVGATLLLGLAAALSVIPAVLASHAVAGSNAARQRGDLARAQVLGLDAVRLDDRRGDHWNVLGLAQSPASPGAAVTSFRRAGDVAPYEPTYPINAAKDALRVYMANRSEEWKRTALEHARRAVAVDRFGAEAHLVLARTLLSTGSAREAVGEAERAAVLGARTAIVAQRALAVGAEAYLTLGEPDRAVDLLRRAIEIGRDAPESLELTLRTDLGKVLVTMGRLDEARQEAELVLRVQSENVAAKEILAAIRARSR
jgi:O-antigen ligase/tetratricopeptide (TPR) repeat protein